MLCCWESRPISIHLGTSILRNYLITLFDFLADESQTSIGRHSRHIQAIDHRFILVRSPWNAFIRSNVVISRNSSGYELMLCSLDGTVAYIEFTQDELGRPITNDEKDDFFIENYGYAVGKDGGGGQKLIENPDILGLQLPSSLTKTTTTALSQPIQAAASQNSVAPPSQPPPPPPPPATAFSASSFSGTVKGIAVASSTHQNVREESYIWNFSQNSFCFVIESR